LYGGTSPARFQAQPKALQCALQVQTSPGTNARDFGEVATELGPKRCSLASGRGVRGPNAQGAGGRVDLTGLVFPTSVASAVCLMCKHVHRDRQKSIGLSGCRTIPENLLP